MVPMSETQLGLLLRDHALTQSAEGRQAAIHLVRDWLRAHRAATFTGDDIHDAVEALGLAEGDTRWTGNVVKGWAAVTPTHDFTPSRRKERHGAPLRRWVFRA